ncbi:MULTISPECIES: class I adenylate-forming enzyme family protein [unclassified Mycobacterium]|uniref:class I adenylate-forming enzyme family protein n=1 Tax=unclassified Mycobacterium TaxID=2642494 RepID=UPI0029C71A15|nr:MULTISPECIES: AMP-binding protein [unclassified Mycobacterium]
MNTAPSLLDQANKRADALRAGYRAAGFWSASPMDTVRSAALRDATATAVITRTETLSYGELDHRIDRAALALKSFGVTADTPVLLAIGNDVDSVIAVHAVLRVDAVALLAPLNAGRAHLADIAAGASAQVGVAPRSWLATTEGVNEICSWIDLAGAAAEGTASSVASVESRRAADAPSLVLYTSGTTSRPKGVVHSLSTLGKAATNHIVAAGLDSDDRLFVVSPFASVTGALQVMFIGPMLNAPVVLEDSFSPAATAELLASSGGTWFGGPDRLLDRILEEAVKAGRRVPLRAAYVGGTMLDRSVVERVERDFGIVVMRAYGSSEVPTSTSGLRGDSEEMRHSYDGVPLDDVEVRIGSSLDPNECCIRGPHAFLGYTDPEDDEHAYEQGWFHTGDVAELNEGRIRIVGRLRDIVIRNGLKIPIAEVEDAINGLGGVRQCAGYSVPDAVTGERLAVAVVLEAQAVVTFTAVIENLTAAGLAKYKLPEELVIWDEPLPTNANGKVERNKLEAGSQRHPRLRAPRLAELEALG